MSFPIDDFISERCVLCDGRGIISTVDPEEFEKPASCPICNGMGTMRTNINNKEKED